MKDLIPICLENESQDHSMTLNMVYQKTLILYHTEAFVKTESACTVEVNVRTILDWGRSKNRSKNGTSVIDDTLSRQYTLS